MIIVCYLFIIMFTLRNLLFIFSGGDDISWELCSISSLRALVTAVDQKGSRNTLPRMKQEHFIALWRSLYDMLQDHLDNEDMYHSIASVGMY